MFHIEGIPGRWNDFFPKKRSRQKIRRFHFSIFFSKFQKEVLEDFRGRLTYYWRSRNFDPFYILGAKYQNMLQEWLGKQFDPKKYGWEMKN